MEKLTHFFEPFLSSVGSFLPGVLGALLVLIIGWFLAGVIRRIVERLLKRTDLDNRLFKGRASNINPEKFIAKLVYYLVMLIVLLVVLEMLGVHNVLDPVKNMVNEFFGFVPNVVAAGIIGFAGYIIATIASEVVSFASNAIENYSSKMGLSSSMDISTILKQLVFIIVFIPILIQALDALGMRIISDPAKEMLSTFINAIPNILVAAIIIGVFYIGGRYLSKIGAELLKNLGTDEMPAKLGLTNMIGENVSLSKMVANLGFFFLMFTGIIMAVEKLNFPQMSEMLSNLMELTGQIFFGLIIMAIGSFIANIAHKALSNSDTDAFIASLARIAILGLFLAIALRTMGIANDIINLAFGLTLGAVAVAFALSFGLGGREAAGKQMEHFLSKFRSNK